MTVAVLDRESIFFESSSTTKYVYDESNFLKQTTDSSGNVTSFSHDEKGNITQILLPNGNYFKNEYNSRGQLIKTVTFDGEVTRFFYDKITGNLITVEDPLGNKVIYVHDLAGNVIRTIDKNNYTTHMTYNLMNRLEYTLTPKGEETYLSYNEKGHLTSVIDARGNETKFENDSQGRVRKRTDPNNFFETFSYGFDGKLEAKTDKNGNLTQYFYDSEGRNDEVVTSDDHVRSVFSTDGNLESVENKNQKITYEYGEHNNKVEKVTYHNLFNNEVFSLNYEYNWQGDLVAVVDSSGNRIEYSLNEIKQLYNIRLPNGKYVYFGYDKQNRKTLTDYSNDTFRHQGFNKDGTIAYVRNNGPSGSINSREYKRDKSGNILSFIEDSNLASAKNLSYEYDENNQLISEINPFSSGSISYQFDELGNRLSVNNEPRSSTFDKSNRILEDQNFVYEYDNNGNTTAMIDKNNGPSYKIFWDDKNQLEVIEFYTTNPSVTEKSNPVKIVRYLYGPLGKRLAKYIDNNLVEYYFYSGDNIHTIKGVEGERLIIHSDQIDMPVAMVKNNSDYSYHSDQLGSVLALTDSNNNISVQYNYDAFGNMKVYDSNGVETATDNSGNIYGYTGREIDKESPFYYYRARYYNPETGRFISEDPRNIEGGLNIYSFNFNNPLKYKDLTGETPVSIQRLIEEQKRLQEYLGEVVYTPEEEGILHTVGEICKETVGAESKTQKRDRLRQELFDVADKIKALRKALASFCYKDKGETSPFYLTECERIFDKQVGLQK